LLEQVKTGKAACGGGQQNRQGKFYTRDAKRVPEAGTSLTIKPNLSVSAAATDMVLEERRSRKPAVTKRGMYKVIGLFAVFVVLLVLIF
jgi:hypothetical protein